MKYERGALVAGALAGSWRESPPAPTLGPDQLDRIAPLLLETGCGSLAWWRMRESPLAASPTGEQLRDAYRMHSLQAAVHERELAEVVRALRAAGVEGL